MTEEFKKRDGDWKEGKIPQSQVMNWVWHARACSWLPKFTMYGWYTV